MTPEHLRELFDLNAIMIIFAWGLLQKYLPALRDWANWLIPWIGTAGYILARLVGGAFVGDAHAQVVTDSVLVTTGTAAQVPALIGIIIGGITNTGWATIVYEKFARALIEKLWPKAAKAASQNPVGRHHA